MDLFILLINILLSNTEMYWVQFELVIGMFGVSTQKLVTMTEIFMVCLFR
jgi:hypothetical protein